MRSHFWAVRKECLRLNLTVALLVTEPQLTKYKLKADHFWKTLKLEQTHKLQIRYLELIVKSSSVILFSKADT